MFFNRRKKQRPGELFILQDLEYLDQVDLAGDDHFFDEAFAEHTHSALESTKSFFGSLVPAGRFRGFTMIITLVFFALAGRASALQLVNGNDYRAQAENNRMKHVTLPAQRGIIYDRNGVILAENIPSFSITTSREQLPTTAEARRAILEKIADFVERPRQEIFDAVSAAESFDDQILIAEDIPYDSAMKFLTLSEKFPGFALEVGSRRKYITDQIPSLSHVIGYTGAINEFEYVNAAEKGYRRFDHIGKQGVEQKYEDELRGTFGEEIIEVDALGHIERVVSKRDPDDGENITLSIDSELQKKAEEIINAHIEGTAASRVSLIVMNPKNGELLSLVSWPAYDANLFSEGIDQETYSALVNDENLPLFPRATSGEFPSGSTIKPVYAAAALNEGIITPTTSFLSVGGLRIGQWFFPDWRAGGHGVTNVYHAIADSVNTFFYIIGGGYESFEGLGIDRLMSYAATFGFGSQTGVDIPGEATGFLPNPAWKLETKDEVWYIGDTYHVAIGQGDFLATPLQIAQSTAIFANDGVRVRPHVNMALQPSSEVIISSEIAQIIKDAMRTTVTNGSASSMQRVPVPVAGKTGTAQWSTVRPNHSWFTGFAPYEDPQVVITVLVEEGADASLAVPIARELLTWYFSQN